MQTHMHTHTHAHTCADIIYYKITIKSSKSSADSNTMTCRCGFSNLSVHVLTLICERSFLHFSNYNTSRAHSGHYHIVLNVNRQEGG